MRFINAIVGVLIWYLALALFGLLLASCHDKVVSPPTTHIEYAAYWYDWGLAGNEIDCKPYYRYNLNANTLDSFSVATLTRKNVAPYQMAASIDGKRLFVPGDDGEYPYVIDAENLTVLGHLPAVGRIAVSSDGKYLGLSGDGLTIIDANTYGTVFHDTDKLYFGGTFTPKGDCYYDRGVMTDSTGTWNYVYKLDIAHGFTVTRKKMTAVGGGYVQFQTDSTGTLLLLMLAGGWDWDGFVVYNVDADSVLYGEWLFPGKGHILSNPWNNHVYVTNPGDLMMGTPGSPFLDYDLATMRVDTVPQLHNCDSSQTLAAIPAELSMSPDGRWLASANRWGSPSVLALYDLQTKQSRFVCRPMTYSNPVIVRREVLDK